VPEDVGRLGPSETAATRPRSRQLVTSDSALTLAVVGCGAMTRDVHLPALSECAEFRLAGLVDARIDFALQLGEQFGVDWTASNHADAVGRVDAVLLALPNHLHAPVAIDFLEAGVHTLVEKPMALTAADCDRMIDAAERSGAVLAVALNRRLFHSNRFVRTLVETRAFGRARAFRVSGEGLYPWPMRSAYRYDPTFAGGGILADTGIHVLDLLCWWFGDCTSVEYADDSEGGVEAECHIELVFACDVSGDVVLSRARDVPSEFWFEFERGKLTFQNAGSEPSPRCRLVAADREWEPIGEHGAVGPPTTRREIFRRQFADFAAAIRTGCEPSVSGREGRRSVELMERCYASRRQLQYPWERAG
jgi:predicted dehydrogenase